MLNERFDDRAKMRNRATQTENKVSSSLVQTDAIRKIEDLPPLATVLAQNEDDEEDRSSNKRPGSFKRSLYIYNVGD